MYICVIKCLEVINAYTNGNSLTAFYYPVYLSHNVQNELN